MSRVTKNISKILVCALVLALVFPLVNLVSGGAAQTVGERVKVQDHQFIVQELDNSGKVENVRVLDWLALKGNGTVDVTRPTGFSKPPKIQNMAGFQAPEVSGDTITWKGLQATGTVNVSNVINQNILNKADLNESTMREKMPLELRYTYFLDGKRVKNLKDIAGKSGHFRLECFMKNLSKKKEMVTYTDSATGERKTELAEVYLPLVISPNDWYFDNTVYSNLKTDPRGIISYIPTDYNLSWSIALFPPATEPTNTIWMEADVKNFSMKPLTMTAAFIFPLTNQKDTIPMFQASLSQLYGGIALLGAGLGQAVAGVGSPTLNPSLLYAGTQILGGLELLADPVVGLPFAANAIQTQFIPGVNTLVAGLGTAQTPNTLLWATDQTSSGLSQIAAGLQTQLLPAIGKPGDSALKGQATLIGGLDDIKGAIGNPTDSLAAGQASLMAGLNEIKVGLGKPTDSATAGQASLLGAFNDLVAPSGLPTLVAAFAPVYSWDTPISFGPYKIPKPKNVYSALNMIARLCNPADPEFGNVAVPPNPTGLYPLRDTIIPIVVNGLPPDAGLLQQLCTGPDATGPNASAYQATKYLLDNVGTVSDTYPAQKTLFAAVNGISAGVGNSTDTYPAQQSLYAGLNGISAGVGSATIPNTLLAGIGTPTDSATAGQATLYGGLNDINNGIGSATTNPSLLYATNAIYGGLSQVKASASTGSTTNPGLLEGLEQLGSGLNTAVAGLGSASTSNTLIWATDQENSGLEQLKAGLDQAYTGVTGQLQPAVGAGVKQLDLTVGQLEAITQRGKKFDTYLGRVQNRGSTSDMRFYLQTKPVQNPNQNNGWLIALVISLIGAAALVVLGLFAFKKYA
jgi:hypothetical protein